MAVDSKYADLPGIDTQPDVYESSDVAPMNVPAQTDVGSEFVETLTINTQKSFGMFKDKYLDPHGADFSDSLGSHRRTGYEAGDFCSLRELEKPETPLQKYERLQRELQELAAEVKDMKGSETSEGASATAGGPSHVEFSQQVAVLQSHLLNLQSDTLSSVSQRPGPALQADLSKKLLSQVEAFSDRTAGAASAAVDTTQKDAAADGISYNVYYQPAQTAFSGLSKASELEQRLAQLEKLLGKDSRSLTTITSGVAGANGDLLSAMSVLQSKMALLEPGYAEAVNGRLATLLHNLKQLQQSKSAEDEAKKTKVAELYDMVNRWDSVAVAVPDLLSRLKSLKLLHEQATHFGNTLRDVDIGQQQINGRLESQSKVLSDLKESLRVNMESIQTNCQNLESRIQRLMES
ncbi:dynactin subunit 2-like [Sycon ciliatum]|uniref:dynactin subunit 2-like n=1 Tax=Sycon ciliatum TaxID=27933 RepID=UPI0020A95890|eukprot:scpid80503/ scgid7508/ Dynactin subunit 2; 50 kDa dynein-associated polypeptide; Dynactin complex 50 kDa subunit; Growth cone membrane protein 23-48K; p50 dynamitin